jgi:hypothetical protein
MDASRIEMWRGHTRGVDMDAPARTAAPAGVPATWMTAAGMSPSRRFRRQRHAGAHAQRQTNDAKGSRDVCRPNVFRYLLH